MHMRKEPYVIPDPLSVRLRGAFWKHVGCRVVGHRLIKKFGGTVLCERHDW